MIKRFRSNLEYPVLEILEKTTTSLVEIIVRSGRWPSQNIRNLLKKAAHRLTGGLLKILMQMLFQE